MNVRLRAGARALRILLIAGMLLTLLPAVAMAQTTGISGDVTDAETGLPIDGAIVVAQSAETSGTTTTLTGSYSLDVPAGVYDVTIAKFGYLPFDARVTVSDGEFEDLDAALVPLVPVVSGTVTEAGSDEPLEDALVLAVQYDEAEQEWITVSEFRTGPDGTYEFTNAMLPEGSYIIMTAPGTYEGTAYQSRFYSTSGSVKLVADADEVVVDWSSPRTGIDIALDPAPDLSGQVICAAAKRPLPGTVVSINGGVFTTTVDAAGMYEFADLPAGEHTVRFTRTGFLPLERTITVVDGEPIVLDVELVINPDTVGRVQGFVTDADTGEPIHHANVNVNMGWTGTTTAEDGSYGINVPEGTHQFEYSAPGYAPFTEMVSVGASATVQNDVQLEPTAGPTTGDLHGIVRDEGGQALADVMVTVNGTLHAMTTAAGVYDFADLPVGEHDITFELDGYVTLARTFTIVAGQTTHLDVTLVEEGPTTGSLTGVVRDEAGEPVEGALVSINDGAFETVTGADGVYEFASLPAGTHSVMVIADGYVHFEDDFTIVAGEETVLDVVLVEEVIPVDTIDRVWDDTRFSGSVAVAADTFDLDPVEPGVQWGDIRHIIIASGEDRAAADPLAAAGLAGAYEAPMFLVHSASVSAEVEAAINDIVDEAAGTVTLHIVGGPVSVPNARITEIQNAVDAGGKLTSERLLSTGNRYDLAGAIAVRMAELLGDPEVVLLANGQDPSKFFDALALSPIAAAQGYPILLTTRDDIPEGTIEALDAVAPDPDAIEVVIGGGPNTVSTDLEDAFIAILGEEDVTRWSGATRYETALAIADGAVGRGWLTRGLVGVAAKLPDALTGGAAVGLQGGVLVLTESTRLTPATRVWLETHEEHIVRVAIFGGPASILPVVVDAIEAIVNPQP